jgi:hypothetical protein
VKIYPLKMETINRHLSVGVQNNPHLPAATPPNTTVTILSGCSLR